MLSRATRMRCLATTWVPVMANDPPDNPPPRRVGPGHDTHAVAKVLMDGPATNRKSSSPGTVSTLIWSTDGAPADIAIGETIEDLGTRILGTAPPANGTL